MIFSSHIFRVLSLLFALTFLSACNDKADKTAQNASAVSQRTYRVSMSPPGYAPLNFRSATGEPQGFEHDILQEVAKRRNLHFEYSYMPWRSLFEQLENRQTDLLSSGISITDERKEKYGMSENYLEVDPVAIVTKDQNVKNLQDLASKPIAVKRNTQHEKRLIELNRGKNDYAVYAESTWLNVLKVINNEAYATFADSPVMSNYVANNSKYGLRLVVDTSFPKDYYGFVMRKDDTQLLHEVNLALAEMKRDGTYQQIVHKWFAPKAKT